MVYYKRCKKITYMVISVGAKLFYVQRAVAEREVYGRKNQNGGKKNERDLNETIIRSRCSLWTSNKKMES